MPLSDRRLLAAPDAENAPEAAGEPDAPMQKRKRARAGGAKALADLEIADKVQPLKPATAPPKPVDKLAKLGLKSDIDLVLHLPMRYEDETSITPIGHLIPGDNTQTEGVVFDNEIAYRPRRQLLVKIHDDAGDELTLRFLNFYGSQVKQMAIGVRLRVRGDVRGGFFGMEMVHPAVRPVDEDTPLPQALTPVYPSTAGVSQAYLRKAIDSALARTALAEAVRTLHHPSVDADEAALIDGSHPAWSRIKFDELLAQQLSLKRAHEERRRRTAPAVPPRPGGDLGSRAER